MTQYVFRPVPTYKADLKAKGGLLNATSASNMGAYVLGKTPVQQTFLNKVFNYNNGYPPCKKILPKL